jgi:predicted tellurium resistance membrane protein TerC
MDDLLTLAAQPASWAALLTLIVMEVVLGIDNLIFVAILTNRLPEHQRESGRRIGISLALILRLVLLGAIALIVKLVVPIFSIFGQSFSWRDLILFAGGLFLVWKATKEIHHRIEPDHGRDAEDSKNIGRSFGATIAQIVLLDSVFSIDSIITAVGMTDQVPIMIVAVIFAVAVMLIAATPLSNFINANPTIIMLALGFLLMIGMALIAEGFGTHVPKGYIYAAMAFSASIESLNMLARRSRSRKRAAGKPEGQ